jgi:hypothetical protein
MLAVAGAIAGCGRRGFDLEDDATGPGPGDAALADVAVDVPPGQVAYTFGNWAGATHPDTCFETMVRAGVSESSFNYGGAPAISVEPTEPQRGLIRFDISVIPAGSTIASARIRLTGTLEATTVVEFRRVREAWLEGAAAGTPGTANWMTRDDPGVPWTAPGAGAPGSSDAAVLATIVDPGAIAVTVNLPLALVSDWIDNGNNFGLVVDSTIDVWGFATTEGSEENRRPLLTVVFAPP